MCVCLFVCDYSEVYIFLTSFTRLIAWTATATASMAAGPKPCSAPAPAWTQAPVQWSRRTACLHKTQDDVPSRRRVHVNWYKLMAVVHKVLQRGGINKSGYKTYKSKG
jgi:hypothetical protein